MTTIRTFSRAFALSALLLAGVSPVVTFAKVVGVSGNVYQIAEPDSLKELEDKAASMDLNESIIKEETTRKIEQYRPFNAVSLPPAKEDRTSLVDMTYMLEFDIPDGRGGILYPKGFAFNPLEYVPFTRTIVILNGETENEVDWFTASEYYKRTDVMLLVTDGAWKDLMYRFKRSVFYLTEPVATRFRISSTPSVITKKDNKYMEVKEIHVDKKDDKKRHN